MMSWLLLGASYRYAVSNRMRYMFIYWRDLFISVAFPIDKAFNFVEPGCFYCTHPIYLVTTSMLLSVDDWITYIPSTFVVYSTPCENKITNVFIAMVSLFFSFSHQNPYFVLNFATFQLAVSSNLMQMGWLIPFTEDPTSAWCLLCQHLLDHNWWIVCLRPYLQYFWLLSINVFSHDFRNA